MRKILVIDDERPFVDTVVITLEDSGYQVLAELDSEAGMRCVFQWNPDLILLDISMPGGSGFSLARTLRNLYGEKAPPFIFITGMNDSHLEDKAALFEPAGLLHKPFEMRELRSRIERVIGEPPELSVTFCT